MIRYLSTLLVFLIAGTHLTMQQGQAQSIQLSGSVTASFHSHQFDEPLPWWDNAGLLFPSLSFNAQVPMHFIGGPLSRKLFFRTGLRYTRLASRVDWQSEVTNNGEAFTGKFQISQHYLLVPVQLKLTLGNSPVFLFGGPEFGLLLFANKDSDTLTPVEFKSSQSENVGEDINTVHISLGGGIGARLSPQLISFARYTVGMSNAKKDAERTVLDTDWRTKEIEFGVEFLFKKRKDP